MKPQPSPNGVTPLAEATEKVEVARTKILLSRPLAFWAGLMVQIPWEVMSPTAPTAPRTAYATTNKIVFNAEFVATLSVEEVGFLILHELSHILRQDHWRVGDRNPQRWNIAADLFINEALRALPVCAPANAGGGTATLSAPIQALAEGLYFDTYENGAYARLQDADTETVYDALPDGEESPTDELRPGGASADQRREDEADLRRLVTAAKELASQANPDALRDAGGWVQDFVDRLLTPKVDWRIVLQDFMLAAAEQDWRWSRPHTSTYVSIGGIVPSLQQSPAVGDVVVLLDSSASVDDARLAQAWGEIKGMAHLVSILHIVHFTTQIDRVDTYENTPEDISPSERFEGGTAIDTAVESLASRLDMGALSADVVIILSDMYSVLPKEPAGGFPPTLWVNLAPENRSFKAPFGVQITIE